MGMTPPKMFPPSLPFAASQPNVISQAQAAPVLAQQNLLPSNFQDPGPGQALPNPQANPSAAYFGNQNNYQVPASRSQSLRLLANPLKTWEHSCANSAYSRCCV
jgi:hypothetical protein